MKSIKIKIVKYTSFRETGHRQTFDGYLYEGVLTENTYVYVSSEDITYNEAKELSNYVKHVETEYGEWDSVPDFSPIEYLGCDLSVLNNMGIHKFEIATKDEEASYFVQNIIEKYTKALAEIHSLTEMKRNTVEAEYKQKMQAIENEYKQKIKYIEKCNDDKIKEFWEEKFLNGLCIYNIVHPLLGKPLEWAFENGVTSVFINCMKDPKFNILDLDYFVGKYTDDKLRKVLIQLETTDDIDLIIDTICLYHQKNSNFQITNWEFQLCWRGIAICVQSNFIDKISQYVYPIAKRTLHIHELFNWDEIIDDNFYYIDLICLIYNSNIFKMEEKGHSVLNFDTYLFEDILSMRKFLKAPMVLKLKECVSIVYQKMYGNMPSFYLDESWKDDAQLEHIIQKRKG